VSQLDFKEEEIMLISAKQGVGVPELLEAIIDRFSPPPKAER